jgi:molybdopterin synthase catalytic subunit
MANGLALALVVHNTGGILILRSTVTVQVKSSAREYLQAAAPDIKINPGGN